jgi:hypothetical protein
MVFSWGQSPGSSASLWVTSGAGSQSSLAVAGPPVAAGAVDVPHWTVASAGHEIVGLFVSDMLTSAWQVCGGAVPSLTDNVTVQSMSQPLDVSTDRIGVSLVELSNVAFGQSVDHE